MIYIDGLFLAQRINGINRYSRETLKVIAEGCERVGLRINVLVPLNSEINDAYGLEIIRLEHPVKIDNEGNKTFSGWTRKTAERYSYERKGIFVNFSGYAPRKANGPCVIHDLRPVCYDDGTKPYQNMKFKAAFRLNCEIAKRRRLPIMTVSAYSKQTIIDTLKVSGETIHISYCGWQHVLDIQENDVIFRKHPELLAKPYVFALGSIAAHKNFKWIVEVAKRNPEIMFAIAGGKELETFGTSGEIEERNNLIYLGYINDGEAKSLMKKAIAFLFPSLYEGFGIPPFEAMAVGTEVIASRETCLPEILGNSVHYINANDPNVNIIQLLKQSSVSECSKQVILSRYSWEKTGQTWLKLLSEMENN